MPKFSKSRKNQIVDFLHENDDLNWREMPEQVRKNFEIEEDLSCEDLDDIYKEWLDGLLD